MSLSSTSIIHLTGSLDTLFTILNDGFRPKYCYEHIRSSKAKKILEAAFPMVSFSDIPLSELKNQLDSYGDYGIGLTKAWAKEKGLNPVIYMEHSSHLLERMVSTFIESLKKRNDSKAPKEEKAFTDLFLNIMSYSKNYEGRLIRKTKEVIKDYRFSDEREWRYVPPIKILRDNKAKLFVPAKDYKNNKDKWNQIIEPIRVKLKARDIKYIIIKNESELSSTIQFIQSYVKKDFPNLQNKLISRIITSDQIRRDL